MNIQYILRKSLCRPPHCASEATAKQTAESLIENLGFAPGYAEPGYTDPKKGVLLSNWNYFPRNLDTILERYGYDIEWEDEWTTCGNCGKALRTQPDSYGWQPSYVEQDGDFYCPECADIEDYLESLEDNPRKALNHPSINPADYGYTELQDGFENGFHPGQNDNPQKIYKRLVECGHKRILFYINGVGQFDIGFSVWEKAVDAVDGDS